MHQPVKRTSAARQVIEKKAEWLEDVLAGLLTAGVRMNEIEVQEHPGLRTVVLVRGEPKYEFNIKTA